MINITIVTDLVELVHLVEFLKLSLSSLVITSTLLKCFFITSLQGLLSPIILINEIIN